MKIKALAPWFGGKRNLAPRIVAELGMHRVYWEPFCGSMAVLLAKPPCNMETVNDLHAGLYNLACVIQDPCDGPRLYRMLRRTLMHEDFFTDADMVIREQERASCNLDTDVVCMAYRYFLVSWLGRNGTAGTPASHKGTYCVRFTNKGGHGATRLRSAVMSIPAWRRRMQRVTILNRDGFELLTRIEDAKGTAIYVDPPYIEKGSKYLHDFDSEDHNRLAELLKRFQKARVVVSYYDHPKLAELYEDWSRVEIVVNKAMAHAGRRGKSQVKATEVLLINGPSYTSDANPKTKSLFPAP